MIRWLCMLVLAAAALAPVVSRAHEVTMAEMDVRETTRGEFVWQWTATGNGQLGEGLTPHWPEGCAVDANALHCGEQGLTGTLAIDGVGDRFSAALVKIHWEDGRRSVHTITAAQPTARLFGSADDRRGAGEVARAYTVLGIDHILTGFDHLLFVVALLFLVGFNRRLVYTVTAFTAAHSLTLGLSAFGLLSLRPPPVEAAIALSIVLVAAEALSDRPTLGRRLPAVVAFLFGLVHGLGFAGALREFGLPDNHLLVALLTFNVGVEIGQMLLIACAYPVYRALASWPQFALARAPALYAIGSVASYWAIGRVVRLFAF
jgi:hydrogenase/urease accessory protein HupE